MLYWSSAFVSCYCNFVHSTSFVIFITIFLVITGKSMNFGRKGTENWHFLKKYGAVLCSTSHYR